MNEIIVTQSTRGGIAVFFPVNHEANMLTRLVGRKYLTPKQIVYAKEMGHKVTVTSPLNSISFVPRRTK